MRKARDAQQVDPGPYSAFRRLAASLRGLLADERTWR